MTPLGTTITLRHLLPQLSHKSRELLLRRHVVILLSLREYPGAGHGGRTHYAHEPHMATCLISAGRKGLRLRVAWSPLARPEAAL